MVPQNEETPLDCLGCEILFHRTWKFVGMVDDFEGIPILEALVLVETPADPDRADACCCCFSDVAQRIGNKEAVFWRKLVALEEHVHLFDFARVDVVAKDVFKILCGVVFFKE